MRSEVRVMRWWEAALASGVRVSRQEKRIGVAALATALCLVLACAGSAASGSSKASTFTGYAFDACNAPKLTSLQAWLASPYRALGIYIGGSDRACANDQLSPTWAAGAVALGWNLIPLYVGPQAPCWHGGAARFDASSAASQGTATADDADANASALGLPGNSPIYYDMEGYSLHDAACTKAVQDFVSAWVTELHALGHLAGVYGSGATTMRDLQPLASTPASPDQIWLADWNGVESVFGNPYLPDTLWTNHQRLHQYRGGHHETWGGVTIDVDSNYVDGAVVGTAGIAPPPTAPSANPSQVSSAGSVSAGDGVSSVSWPAGAFEQPVVVTLTPTPQVQPAPGFRSGGYGVQLQIAKTAPVTLTPTPTSLVKPSTGLESGGFGVQLRASQTAPVPLSTGFVLPLTVHLAALPGNLAPMSSKDGVTWTALRPLVGGELPEGAKAGYVRNAGGSVDITTTFAGTFALMPEASQPPAPARLTGHFSHGSLILTWPRSVGATGPAVSYQVTVSNRPVLAIPETTASLGALHHASASVFRVVAVDTAGKASRPSKPLVVLPSPRPAKLPKLIPHWAFDLFDWMQNGRDGTRPAAPRIPPRWYWRWYAWHAAPFHFRR